MRDTIQVAIDRDLADRVREAAVKDRRSLRMQIEAMLEARLDAAADDQQPAPAGE